jgi:hypothetical protein
MTQVPRVRAMKRVTAILIPYCNKLVRLSLSVTSILV